MGTKRFCKGGADRPRLFPVFAAGRDIISENCDAFRRSVVSAVVFRRKDAINYGILPECRYRCAVKEKHCGND